MLLFPITALASLLWLDLVTAAIYPTKFDGVTWDGDNWVLTTTKLDQGHYQSRMSLSNGYLGINVAAAGPFFEVDEQVAEDNINGWPLFDRRQSFATIAGFYDSQASTNGTNFPWLLQYGAESIISGIPHWSGLLLDVNRQTLDASVNSEQITNFESALDIKSALLTWSYTWTPKDSPAIKVEYSMFVHKLYVNQAAIQLTLTAAEDVSATVTDVLDGDAAVYTSFVDKGFNADTSTIWSAVQPQWITNVTAYIYSTLVKSGNRETSNHSQTQEKLFGGNESSIAQSLDIDLKAGQPVTLEKFIGIASTDAFPDPQGVAWNTSTSGARSGFNTLLCSHKEEWATILTIDSVDSFSLADGSLPDDEDIIELQIMAVTNPFHLLQNTVGANAIAAAHNNDRLDIHSIPVCGLGSSCYAGMIFWDSDVWMAPGLVVSHPQAASQITKYRVEKFPQAKQNVKTAYQSSKNSTGQFSEGGAVYPWTSGRYGNCTGTGPCFDYEYHLNGDIGLQFYNYLAASGDTGYFKENLLPIFDAIATFFSDLIGYNKTSQLYYLTNATDPDEYANHVDNVGFTMALMKSHLQEANQLRSRFGIAENDLWNTQSDQMTIPVNKEANIILEYADQNGTINVKQADVILVDDFLDYPNPYSLSDLEYYAGKQSLNGPGMTYGVFSVVSNKVSPSGCGSYTYDLYGSSPYVRAPWFQYSEQLSDNYTANGGTHPAYPFLTGMGGANRVAVFGYLGLRLQLDAFNVDPSLPPQIPYLNYRTLYWQGHALDVKSNQTHTSITRLSKSLPNSNPAYKDGPIPVKQGFGGKMTPLSFAEPLILSNRLAGQNQTIEGNIAQCRPVTADKDFLPGQFPLAAVDGTVSTKWQPVSAKVVSNITVEITTGSDFHPIASIYLDWAQNPPTFYSVTFHNQSELSVLTPTEYVIVASDDQVAISNPYDPDLAAAIVPYISNSTNVTLDKSVWSGRYATLSILGNQGTPEDTENAGDGATVAEWAIIAESIGALPVREAVLEL